MDTILWFFDFLYSFINGVAEFLGVSPVWVAFFTGGIVISVIVGIVARIRFTMGIWAHAAQAAFQPQQAYTTQTPHQVVQASRAAQRNLTGCRFIMWISVLGIVVACLVWLLGPATVFAWVQEALQGLFGP